MLKKEVNNLISRAIYLKTQYNHSYYKNIGAHCCETHGPLFRRCNESN